MVGEVAPAQRLFKVATFCDPGETRRSRVTTYTLWYSEEWSRCRVFELWASTAAEARRKAVELRLAEEARRP